MHGGPKETIWRLDRDYDQDDRDAPRDARLAISAQGELPSHVRDDLLIVVTELLTNAIRHAAKVAGGRISVSVEREPDAVHIEVRNPGGGFTVSDPAREGGYGLIAVDRISSEWGVSVTDTTLVWCSIETPAEA